MAAPFSSISRHLISASRPRVARHILGVQWAAKWDLHTVELGLLSSRCTNCRRYTLNSSSSGLLAVSSARSSRSRTSKYQKPVTSPQSSIVSKASFSTSCQRPIFGGLFGRKGRSGSSSRGGDVKQEIYITPYRPKRQWPPDLSQLSQKEQFRLERKYRRRAKLKYARPTWNKWTKLVQWTLIGFVVVYAALFMEMTGGGPNPFESFRKWLRKQFNTDAMWTRPQPRSGKNDSTEQLDTSPISSRS